jgi:hypothetical protein
MTSLKQIEANRRNAQKSTGPISQEGKHRSRCNAIRHGLTGETVIGAFEDAADYAAFEANVIADYDAQSAVERELVLRLASLLWRLRRVTAIETGLFQMQAEHFSRFRQARNVHQGSHDVVCAMFRHIHSASRDHDRTACDTTNAAEAKAKSALPSGESDVDDATELARSFFCLANLPNYVLDRLSRYEAALWRQVGQILFALDTLDRRKPQERRPFSFRRR